MFDQKHRAEVPSCDTECVSIQIPKIPPFSVSSGSLAAMPPKSTRPSHRAKEYFQSLRHKRRRLKEVSCTPEPTQVPRSAMPPPSKDPTKDRSQKRKEPLPTSHTEIQPNKRPRLSRGSNQSAFEAHCIEERLRYVEHLLAQGHQGGLPYPIAAPLAPIGWGSTPITPGTCSDLAVSCLCPKC